MAATTAAGEAGLAAAAAPQAAREIASIVEAARAAGRDLADEGLSKQVMEWLARVDGDVAAQLAAVAAIDAKEPKPSLLKVYAATNGSWVITGNSQGVQSGGQDVFVLARGEVGRKKGKAATGFVLATLAADDAESRLLSGPDSKPLADPRLGLANFLSDVSQGAGPLAARVIANRLWHLHFGRGIVATPNDLGTQGDPPSHPELLEWLAGRLVENRWSLKSLHRLIVTSAAYRQSGMVDEARRAKDPDNVLLWHRKPRRLEGEAIRDALLATSGGLDTTMYGRAGLDPKSPRRSIYLNVKRSEPIGFLQVFDQPEPVQSVGSRGVATVPTQALAMMNSPLVRSAADRLAGKVIAAVGPNATADATIDACFMAALARRPSDAEREKFVTLLSGREAAGGTTAGGKASPGPAVKPAAVGDVCHLIFCLNEFIYVD